MGWSSNQGRTFFQKLMNNFIGKHTFQQKKWRKDERTRAYTNLVVWPSPYACLFHQSFFVKRDQKVAPDLHISSASGDEVISEVLSAFNCTLLSTDAFKKKLAINRMHTLYLLIKIKTHLNWAALLINAMKAINLMWVTSIKSFRLVKEAKPQSPRLHCKLPSVSKLSSQLTRVANFRKWISKVQSELRGLYQLLVIHW